MSPFWSGIAALRLSAPEKRLDGGASSPNGADALLERQRRAGASWQEPAATPSGAGSSKHARSFSPNKGKGKGKDVGAPTQGGSAGAGEDGDKRGRGYAPSAPPAHKRGGSQERLAMPMPVPHLASGVASPSYEASPSAADAFAGPKMPVPRLPRAWDPPKNPRTQWNGGLPGPPVTYPSGRPPSPQSTAASAGSWVPLATPTSWGVSQRQEAGPSRSPQPLLEQGQGQKQTGGPSSSKPRPRPPDGLAATPQKASPAPSPACSPAPETVAEDRNRCHGTTASGKRCTRKAAKEEDGQEVEVEGLEGMLTSQEGEEGSGNGSANGSGRTEVPRFCKQHAKQTLSEAGTFAGPKGVYVKFDDWIPNELPSATKIHLRHCLSTQPTDSDSTMTGYLYVHEFAPAPGSGSSPLTHIKLGRSVKPVSRHGQWSAQCPSRTPIVRGFFPTDRSGDSGGNGGGLRGAQTVAKEGITCHKKWERLCLLELAGWEALARGKAEGSRGGVRRAKEGKEPCGDCGKRHVEVFELERGSYERLVKGMVERWERLCRDVLAG